MLIVHTRSATFTMNSEADSGPFFHLASPPRSPGGSPILPLSHRTPATAPLPTDISTAPAYSAAIIPTLGIKAVTAVFAFLAFLVLILGQQSWRRRDNSFTMTGVFLLLQSLWNVLMIGRYFLRDSQGRHGNEANEKKIRVVESGLIVGIVLSLFVGYLVLDGPVSWYYEGWTWFWGCLLLWLVV